MQKILPSQTIDMVEFFYYLNDFVILWGLEGLAITDHGHLCILFHTENLISNIMLGGSHLHTSMSSCNSNLLKLVPNGQST